MKRYKFMYSDGKKFKSRHGSERFVIGKTYKRDGVIELCNNGYHCSKQINQAFSYINGDVLAIVDVSGKSDKSDDKECYEKMTIVKAYKWTKTDSVKSAIFAAEQVIDIFEKYDKDDKRPREAIEAAKKYLADPSKKNQSAARAADAAARAADAAARAADAAARKKMMRNIEKWLVSHIKELEEYEA